MNKIKMGFKNSMIGKGPYIFFVSILLVLLLGPAGVTFVASFFVYGVTGSSVVFGYPLVLLAGVVGVFAFALAACCMSNK